MADTAPERQRILDHVHQNWIDLISVLEQSSEEELNIPNVIGIWSLKDLLGHLETWDRIAIRKLNYAEQGRIEPWWQIEEMPFSSIDEFNEADADENRHKSIAQLWTELHAAHSQLIERLETSPAVSDELIAEDTHAHYAGHLEDIQRAQARRQ